MREFARKVAEKIGIWLCLPVLVLALMLGGCSGKNNGEVKAPGIVDGEIVTLKAAASGTVERLDMVEGQAVNQGELLVKIDSAKVENQLRELDINAREIEVNSSKISQKLRFLEANLQYLRKQVERFQRLKEKKSIAGEKLESMKLKLMEASTSRFELKKTLEELDIRKEKIANKREYLQLLLEDHAIRSPMTGVVIETFVSRGETVFPGAAIADVLDMSSFYVEIFVEEQELGGLRLNQRVDILVDGVDKPLTGTIARFGKKAEFSPKYIISEQERKSLLYLVKITAVDPGGVLKIGMPVTVVMND
jgi:HlyD family secretion protein